MATLATETWTGTTGAAWPSQWTTGTTATSGSATIQSNQGQLNSGTSVYGVEYAYLSGSTASANMSVLVTVNMPAYSGATITLCSDSAGTSGYSLDLYTYGNTSGGFDFEKISSSGNSELVAFTSIPLTNSSYYVRFQVINGLINFKYWSTSTTEPTAWTATYTDSSPLPAGKLVLAAQYINGGTPNSSVNFDDLTVTDGTSNALPVVATETWTGTTGAAWPSQWTTGTGYGTNTSATIQSNQGQLNVGDTQNGGVHALLTGMPNTSDTDMTVDIPALPTAGNAIISICATDPGNDIADVGYTLVLYCFGNGIGAYGLTKSTSAGSTTPLVSYQSVSYPNAAYTVRLQAIAGTIQFKIWLTSGTEPTAWTATSTDSTPLAAGQVRLAAQYSSAGTSFTTMTYDNLTVSGTVVSSGTGTGTGSGSSNPLLYLGGNAISSVKMGLNDVSAIYIGLNKVYPAAGTAISTAMPTGNVTSNGITWVPDFSNDFTTDAALGSFSSVYNMDVYDDTTHDTSGQGLNSASKVLSVHDSMLDFYLHSENGQPYMATVLPDNYTSRTYARISYRYKTTATGVGYKYVGIMWPISNVWNDGEIDWPEADLTQVPRPANAIPGSYNTTKPNNMVFVPSTTYPAATDSSDWHIATTEWTKNFINFYWDGALVYSLTTVADIPHIPMRVTLQAETFIQEGTVPSATVGHVLIDWIVVYHEQSQES